MDPGKIIDYLVLLNSQNVAVILYAPQAFDVICFKYKLNHFSVGRLSLLLQPQLQLLQRLLQLLLHQLGPSQTSLSATSGRWEQTHAWLSVVHCAQWRLPLLLKLLWQQSGVIHDTLLLCRLWFWCVECCEANVLRGFHSAALLSPTCASTFCPEDTHSHIYQHRLD